MKSAMWAVAAAAAAASAAAQSPAAAGNPYAWRAPVPRSFKTRQTGAVVATPRVGVHPATVVRAGARIVYRARFFDGTEADFADGLVTAVGGRRYVGLGRRAGCYRIRDLDSGEILQFSLAGR